jgi:hypothetical protein
MKQQEPAVMIALGVYRLLVYGLLLGMVAALLLARACGRALRKAGAHCGLWKEPQPQRPRTVDELYPPDWHP